MRISPAQVSALHSWHRDQVVHDPQAEFSLDENLARQQQIKMLRHRTSQRILDGNHRSRDRTADRKSTRLNSSHLVISYAVFCLKKKKKHNNMHIFSIIHSI